MYKGENAIQVYTPRVPLPQEANQLDSFGPRELGSFEPQSEKKVIHKLRLHRVPGHTARPVDLGSILSDFSFRCMRSRKVHEKLLLAAGLQRLRQ